jgi:hypothetical protein
MFHDRLEHVLLIVSLLITVFHQLDLRTISSSLLARHDQASIDLKKPTNLVSDNETRFELAEKNASSICISERFNVQLILLTSRMIFHFDRSSNGRRSRGASSSQVGVVCRPIERCKTFPRKLDALAFDKLHLSCTVRRAFS